MKSIPIKCLINPSSSESRSSRSLRYVGGNHQRCKSVQIDLNTLFTIKMHSGVITLFYSNEYIDPEIFDSTHGYLISKLFRILSDKYKIQFVGDEFSKRWLPHRNYKYKMHVVYNDLGSLKSSNPIIRILSI